jgi:hypothetical protein
MPYTVSRTSVQVVLVVGAELALAHHASFPGLDLRDHPGEQAQPVVGWKNGHAQHVPENSEHEQRFHRGADLEGLLGDFVAG